MSLFLSTESVPPAERDDFWRVLTSPLFLAEPIGANRQMEGFLEARDLGKTVIGPCGFNAQSFLRDRSLVKQYPSESIMLHLVLDGCMTAECDGHDIILYPGDIGLFDLTRTFLTRARAGRNLSALMPRHLLDQRVGRNLLHGCKIGRSHPINRVLRDLLTGVAEKARMLKPALAASVEESTILFLAASITDEAQARRALQADALQEALRDRVVAFIDMHLCDMNLGVERIMSHFGVSRAHLYRCFQPDGGVASAIRNRRLRRAYVLLQARDRQHYSITDIADMAGFQDSSSFSRAFRAEYGVTPSAVREDNSAAGSLCFPDIRTHWSRLSRTHMDAATPLYAPPPSSPNGGAERHDTHMPPRSAFEGVSRKRSPG